jgi:hypothetical protein
MRKVLITAATAALLAIISFPLVSSAEEPEVDYTVEVLEEENQGNPVIDHMHNELEQRYDHHSWLLIPPTVMRMGQPTDPNIYVLPTLPMGDASMTILEIKESTKLEPGGLIGKDPASTLDPYRHAAIPIDSLNRSTATPTEEFIDGARVFGLALVMAALVLSTLTGVNTVRSRRRKLRYLKASGQ